MRSGGERHAFHVGAEQLARDFVREELGRLIDGQAILTTRETASLAADTDAKVGARVLKFLDEWAK